MKYALAEEANSRFFDNIEDVPKKAITMGVGSIFKSRKIMLIATGENKAEAIYNTVYGKVVPEVPASILQFHSDIVLILDKDAAKFLNAKENGLVCPVVNGTDLYIGGKIEIGF